MAQIQSYEIHRVAAYEEIFFVGETPEGNYTASVIHDILNHTLFIAEIRQGNKTLFEGNIDRNEAEQLEDSDLKNLIIEILDTIKARIS